MELSKIVKIYRDIKKKINLRWTETEKAMFIYMQLCNRMEYCEVSNNGKIVLEVQADFYIIKQYVADLR